MIKWILDPTMGAFIGWFTTWVAIKMLFHPRTERRIFGIRVQGVLPKRKKVLAEKLGIVVSEELFSVKDIREKLAAQVHNPRLRNLLDVYLEEAITKKLPEAIPMVRVLLTPVLIATVKGIFFHDLESMLERMMLELSENMEETVDVQEIVRAKVDAFSNDRLEELLLVLMKKEFRFIELVGGVLGFLIGLIQMAIAEFL